MPRARFTSWGSHPRNKKIAPVFSPGVKMALCSMFITTWIKIPRRDREIDSTLYGVLGGESIYKGLIWLKKTP